MRCVQQHRFSYNEAMPVESCTQALSDLALRFGEDDDEEGGMVSDHAQLLSARSPGFLDNLLIEGQDPLFGHAGQGHRCLKTFETSMQCFGQSVISPFTGMGESLTPAGHTCTRWSWNTAWDSRRAVAGAVRHGCVQSRPFGVALLVAGWQEGSGPVLYHTDPSGMFVEHDAKAIGSGSEGAQTTLQVTL